MLFGHRFDHSDPAFQRLIHNVEQFAAAFSTVFDILPALLFFRTLATNFVDNLAVAGVYSFINDYTVSQKNVTLFIFVISLSNFIRFC